MNCAEFFWANPDIIMWIWIFLMAQIMTIVLISSIMERRKTKMESIRESAEAYEPKQTKNIADLKDVNIDLQLEDREGTDKAGVTFKYKVIVVEGEEYRVPGKVIGDLKAILEKKPTLQTFSVIKKGTGLNTQYTVIPLQ